MMEWISIKEKFPAGIERSIPFDGDRSTEVLVFGNNNIHLSRYISYDSGGGHWEGQLLFKVTHWLPIPEPPTE